MKIGPDRPMQYNLNYYPRVWIIIYICVVNNCIGNKNGGMVIIYAWQGWDLMIHGTWRCLTGIKSQNKNKLFRKNQRLLFQWTNLHKNLTLYFSINYKIFNKPGTFGIWILHHHCFLNFSKLGKIFFQALYD